MNTSYNLVSKIGRRPTNEDVELVKINLYSDGGIIDLNFTGADIYVICDGHGGKEVAEYIAPKLIHHLMNKKYSYPLSQSYINKVYDHLQKKLINHPDNIANGCGCTALVVAMYLDSHRIRHAQVINLGDCRAVISRKTNIIALTNDHKPSWPDEKKRIMKVNADTGTNKKIIFEEGDFRIGDLSVSRSFGDLENTPHVTHIPEIKIYQLKNTDNFMIMACDGLWDELRNEEAVSFVEDQKTINQNSMFKFKVHGYDSHGSIASKLADYALIKGSTDNISIIIIFLK